MVVLGGCHALLVLKEGVSMNQRVHDHAYVMTIREIRLHDGRHGNSPGYRRHVKRAARKAARAFYRLETRLSLKSL